MCDLPLHPVPFNPKWNHLAALQLADPGFGNPEKIDVLLGVDVFVTVMRQGRRLGISNSPIALETDFGWVLAGNTESCSPVQQIAAHHVSFLSGDDMLRQFWEIEEKSTSHDAFTADERLALNHFNSQHSRQSDGRFVVPLPKKSDAPFLGESRAQAMRRFQSFERTLHSKGHFKEFESVINEYFQCGHAEPVPEVDLEKPTPYLLPSHARSSEGI